MEPEEQKKAVGQAAMVLVDESRRAAAASTSCLDDPLERGSVAQSHLLFTTTTQYNIILSPGPIECSKHNNHGS